MRGRPVRQGPGGRAARLGRVLVPLPGPGIILVVRVLGVDGYRAGWVAVELAGGAFAQARVAATLVELLAGSPGAVAVGVDMPLGLLDREWRQADIEAAGLIGARRSSVFRVPPRPVWTGFEHHEYAAANRRCRELTGKGFSRQAWALRTKLLEADACWAAGGQPLYEVHPEVSFRQMAGAPLQYGKSTWNGQMTRRSLLTQAGIALPDDLGQAASAPPDDVLDAAAAAWSAYRIATGTARSVPDPPQRDEHGRPIAIWY
jgi:predicted RNase H-like nuclease